MSWSAYIADKDGKSVNCEYCSHYEGCQVQKLVQPVAYILTSVDVCYDKTMATGTARLECLSFNDLTEEKPSRSDDSEG